jgi:hypothetical protein
VEAKEGAYINRTISYSKDRIPRPWPRPCDIRSKCQRLRKDPLRISKNASRRLWHTGIISQHCTFAKTGSHHQSLLLSILWRTQGTMSTRTTFKLASLLCIYYNGEGGNDMSFQVVLPNGRNFTRKRVQTNLSIPSVLTLCQPF